MSNMVRVFSGTVGEVMPPEHPDNPFRSFKANYFGALPYCVARVRPDSGDIRELFCFADFPVQPGDQVRGFRCRSVKGTPAGVLVPDLFGPLLALGEPFEQFAEYAAFRMNQDASVDRTLVSWYLKYPKNDGIPVEEKVHSILQRQGTGACKGLLVSAHADSCTPKSRMMYCTATLNVHLTDNDGTSFSFLVSRYIDYESAKGSVVPVVVFLGQEPKPAIHILPLAPVFTGFIRTLDEVKRNLLTQLITGIAFRMMGRMLYVSSADPIPENNRFRIMITGSADRNTRYLARPISLYNPADKNRDTTYISSPRLFPGMILEAKISADERGLFHFTPIRSMEAPVQPAPEPVDAVPAAAPEDASDEEIIEGDGLLTVREHEVSLWKDPGTEDGGDSENSANGKNQDFKNFRFQYAIHNREIGMLHYDVLQWIGFLKYSTANLIFRLFLCGMLPQDPNSLTAVQKNAVDSILTKHELKTKVLSEGGQPYEIQYPVRKEKQLTRIIHKLQALGLVEATGFNTRSNTPAPAKILIITEQGKNLLRALQRRHCKYDTFAYLRSPRYIKTVLSSNQLCIAYLHALNESCQISQEEIRISPSIVIRQETLAGDAVVRAGFTMVARSRTDNAKSVLFVGESIRNTVGLSKILDDKSIREKIPRMLSIIHTLAQSEKRHTVLTFVFTSYGEMDAYRTYIFDEASKLASSEYFHLYLTYDYLVLGPMEGSHFRLEEKTGKPRRVDDMMQQIQAYLH